jgi:hypothetical protein
MLKYFYILLFFYSYQDVFAQISYSYDNSGNRIKREISGAMPAACYTMKLASNSKYLTNVNGILKVKAANNTDTQRWKLETAGSYVKVVAADNRVLGVAGGGNTEGDLITLQTNGTQDHLLWTRTVLSESSPTSSVFIRKGSALIFGSSLNWGDGDPSDLVTDIRLANDPTYIFGSAKWILEETSCPSSPVRTGIPEDSDIHISEVPDEKPNLLALPNPNAGDFIISFFLENNKRATLSIINMEGKVFHQELLIGAGQYSERISLPTATSGIYIVRLITEEGVKTKKISIAR